MEYVSAYNLVIVKLLHGYLVYKINKAMKKRKSDL